MPIACEAAPEMQLDFDSSWTSTSYPHGVEPNHQQEKPKPQMEARQVVPLPLETNAWTAEDVFTGSYIGEQIWSPSHFLPASSPPGQQLSVEDMLHDPIFGKEMLVI
ncbi:hypothetical protein Ancab_024255 [Ancistrocladus abbreviatus]